MKERPLVSVIVVNYNGRDLLRECLLSIYAQEYQSIEVIVVDNASEDGSAGMVCDEFPDARLLHQEKNVGFAAGNNRGMEASSGEYIALLNNDAVADPQWLSALLHALRERDLTVAASVVRTEGVPETYYQRNGTLNYLGYNIMEVFSDRTKVFYASGAALLFRRDAVDMLFLDEYFLYHEDVFFSWRCRLRGGKIGMVQESVVIHRGSVSVKKQPHSLISYYQFRNRLLNSFLLYEGFTLFRLTPYIAVDILVALFLAALGMRHSFIGIMRALSWLVSHFGWILRHRTTCQNGRSVPDRQIMAWMSSDVVEGDGLLGIAANALSRGYARSAGLSSYD